MISGSLPLDFDGDGAALESASAGSVRETTSVLGTRSVGALSGAALAVARTLPVSVAQDDLGGWCVDRAEAVHGDVHLVAIDLDVVGADAEVGAGPVGHAGC